MIKGHNGFPGIFYRRLHWVNTTNRNWDVGRFWRENELNFVIQFECCGHLMEMLSV